MQRNLIHDCPSSRQLNQFITGNDPDDDIYSPALLYFKSNVTGMAITAVSQEFTVAIFTTDDGYLYKVFTCSCVLFNIGGILIR